jgi:hypothetical protein
MPHEGSVSFLHPLLNPLVTGTPKGQSLIPVQQSLSLRDIVPVGWRRHQCMDDAGFGFGANMRLNPEVQMVALLGLISSPDRLCTSGFSSRREPLRGTGRCQKTGNC